MLPSISAVDVTQETTLLIISSSQPLLRLTFPWTAATGALWLDISCFTVVALSQINRYTLLPIAIEL